jgi:hypothetical protein
MIHPAVASSHDLSCFQQQFGDALSSSEGHHFAPRAVAGAHLGAKEMCQKVGGNVCICICAYMIVYIYIIVYTVITHTYIYTSVNHGIFIFEIPNFKTTHGFGPRLVLVESKFFIMSGFQV